MDEAASSKFTKYLKKFIKVCENNNINLSVFFKNLETLKISYVGDKQLSMPNAYGEYDPGTNEIKINKKGKKENTIYHEFLHAATKTEDDTHVYVGLCAINKKTKSCIGYSINEGLTELLAKHYFKHGESYNREQYYTLMLSKIIGQDKMQEFYFDGDFKGFVEEFSKYINQDVVYDFIMLLDRYFNSKQIYKKPSDDKDIIACNSILTEAFTNRILKENLPLDIAQDILMNYIDELTNQTFTDLNTGQQQVIPGPSLAVIKHSFDRMQIEYIDNGSSIDTTPHFNKELIKN